ncbi:MAG: hypothetical protein K2V38_26020, partial [Gemmataceae bacterium]|nr:hypothetical protein [Gemmataceae bacterium]
MSVRRSWVLAALLLAGSVLPLAVSKGNDPAKQAEEQKKIKARVDEAARRTASTLDAMTFQRLSPNAEQKMLRGVADDLRGLSQTEIKAVLDHLDRAAAVPADATKEQREAATQSRKVVEQLRVMLGQLDVIRNLDEAAERLERAAEKQIKLITDGHTNSARLNGRVDDRDELA